MTDQSAPPFPTAEQVELTRRVEQALTNEIQLLAREGLPLACILTGIAAVAAEFIACNVGEESVAPWFERNGTMARRLLGPQH